MAKSGYLVSSSSLSATTPAFSSSTTTALSTTSTIVPPLRPSTSSSSSLFSSLSAAFPTPPTSTTIRAGGASIRGHKAALGIVTASTPNLRALFSGTGTSTTSSSRSSARPPSSASHLRLVPPPLLLRKSSFTALTPTSLASIPDGSEIDALDPVLTDPHAPNLSPHSPAFSVSASPRKMTALSLSDDASGLAVGDTVDVPGNMYGTVRFLGSVRGKKGVFAGVELHPEFASRGKNNGDVDGVSYFATVAPNAGIFLPASKAVRRDWASAPASSFPHTPPSDHPTGGLKIGTQNSTNYTPPTPGLPKFSASVGPGRAPSPTGKRSRPSLPRPESPSRRMTSTPARPPLPAIPPIPTIPFAPSSSSGSRVFSKYTSPGTARLVQSVRGTTGDPTRKTPRPDRAGPSVGLRSASALGQIPDFDDDDITPVGSQRTKAMAPVNPVSSLSLKMRPGSRAHDDEIDRLKAQLDERDRQLRDQTASLAVMESSLAEVQSLMDSSDGFRPVRGSLDDKNAVQLRNMLREKNEKISMLTAEFDAHRADFRSTIDALETASTETQKLYEKRIEDLSQEIRELETSRLENLDVSSVASQLKQFEEMVQELEEGLEDARRGEAEARGEVEFLRGEVERTRAELRREREKGTTVAGFGPIGSGPGSRPGSGPGPSPDAVAPSHGSTSILKELEQKEDEIGGLKAIIHSLSRDSVPALDDDDRAMAVPANPSAEAREKKLERQLDDLEAILAEKLRREEELEQELEAMRRGVPTSAVGNGGGTISRSLSICNSRDTVILARGPEPRPSEPSQAHALRRPPMLEPMPESDAYSTATEASTLWCELCETNGHDILSCNNFGSASLTPLAAHAHGTPTLPLPLPPSHHRADSSVLPNGQDDAVATPAPLSPDKTKSRPPVLVPAAPIPVPAPAPAPVRGPAPSSMLSPLDAGPFAGKLSGVVDLSKWCAICERDGHDSVDCPCEDAF